MSLALNRSQLIGRRPVWLLEVTWAGRVFRFSSHPVSLSSTVGALPFDGGLDQVEFSEGFDRLSTSPSAQASSMEVIFPVNVAELRRQGHDLSAATGEVSMVLEANGEIDQTWENRFRLISGRVTQPQYGAPNKPTGWAAFTLEEAPYNDAGRIFDAAARISGSTWATYRSDSEGKVYPLVIGNPGKYHDTDGAAQTTAGSPAYVLDYTPLLGSGLGADKLLIAGHPVEANYVTIIDQEGASVVGTVVTEQDVNERPVSTVDVSAAGGVIDRYSDEFWVAWHEGGGMPSPYHPGTALRGAGDVCRYVLGMSTLAVDHGRWAAAAGALNGFLIDTYLNDPDTGPWEWLEDNVLPLIPMSVVPGPDGLWPVIYDRDARTLHAHPVEAGPDFQRSGPVTSERHPADVVNHLTLEYAKDGVGDDFVRYSELSPQPATDDPQATSNLYVKASASRFGEAAEVVETDVVYDPGTASLVLEWWSREKTFSPESVPYMAATHWGWLSVGDTVALTDATLHLSDQVATVLEKAWASTGWAFTLLIDDDLPRDNRAT